MQGAACKETTTDVEEPTTLPTPHNTSMIGGEGQSDVREKHGGDDDDNQSPEYWGLVDLLSPGYGMEAPLGRSVFLHRPPINTHNVYTNHDFTDIQMWAHTTASVLENNTSLCTAKTRSC